ncbi:MAG: hypothetical protein NW241_09265 [Bacteroidia bacterium]|nr:hypothetical protein [Bacteroidia bacterium]
MKPYLLLLPALLLLAACKPCDDPANPECPNYCVDETNPKCPNYDPCWDQLEVSAAFVMEEEVGSFAYVDTLYYLATDTALEGNHVWFRALQEAERYEWKIGTDSRIFNKREFALFFRDPAEVQVTLAVQRTPNTQCYPGDNGLDTVRRRLVIVPRDQAAIVGVYRGAATAAPQEVYEMEIFRRYLLADSTKFDRYRLTGVHPGCDNTERYDVMTTDAAFRGFVFSTRGPDTTTGCFLSWGAAMLSPAGDSLEVRFRKYKSFSPPALLPGTIVFKGSRIE